MKITKEKLLQLIKEEIGGMPHGTGEGNVYPGYGYTMNFPGGQPPDNRTYEPYKGRDPYETGEGPKPALKEGEIYVTQGKNVFLLEFEEGTDHRKGRVTPVGSYEFTIDPAGPTITWFESTPANVRYDASLQKQILEFRGVDE